MKPGPVPPARFKIGDVVVPRDALTEEHGTIDDVIHEWLHGEWREYITYKTKSGCGAGNADLFALVARPAQPSSQPQEKTK